MLFINYNFPQLPPFRTKLSHSVPTPPPATRTNTTTSANADASTSRLPNIPMVINTKYKIPVRPGPRSHTISKTLVASTAATTEVAPHSMPTAHSNQRNSGNVIYTNPTKNYVVTAEAQVPFCTILPPRAKRTSITVGIGSASATSSQTPQAPSSLSSTLGFEEHADWSRDVHTSLFDSPIPQHTYPPPQSQSRLDVVQSSTPTSAPSSSTHVYSQNSNHTHLSSSSLSTPGQTFLYQRRQREIQHQNQYHQGQQSQRLLHHQPNFVQAQRPSSISSSHSEIVTVALRRPRLHMPTQPMSPSCDFTNGTFDPNQPSPTSASSPSSAVSISAGFAAARSRTQLRPRAQAHSVSSFASASSSYATPPTGPGGTGQNNISVNTLLPQPTTLDSVQEQDASSPATSPSSVSIVVAAPTPVSVASGTTIIGTYGTALGTPPTGLGFGSRAKHFGEGSRGSVMLSERIGTTSRTGEDGEGGIGGYQHAFGGNNYYRQYQQKRPNSSSCVLMVDGDGNKMTKSSPMPPPPSPASSSVHFRYAVVRILLHLTFFRLNAKTCSAGALSHGWCSCFRSFFQICKFFRSFPFI